MYQPKFNKQARQWDVINVETNEIVAMLGGGKRGEMDAIRFCERNNK